MIGMNSKQVVSAVSVVVLLVILLYPTLSTGAVSMTLKSNKIGNADHVYVTLRDVWAHQTGQSESQGWRILSNTSKILDLVSLQTTAVLIDGKLPAGMYDSVRVDLANATWVYAGRITVLQLESTQLSSKLDFTVTASRSVPLTLMVGGFQETLQGQRFLSASLNASLLDSSS